jgi:predicted lactoylglutathione lyase
MTPIMKRTSVLSLLAVAVATGVACSSKPAETPAKADGPPLAVRTVAIAEAAVTDAVEAGGVVQARTAATLAARVMAPVQAVRVVPGDRVRAGQVLVELDGRDLTSNARSATAGAAQAREGVTAATAEQRAARAALDLAKATHGRIATLFARKSATAQEMDDAAAALVVNEHIYAMLLTTPFFQSFIPGKICAPTHHEAIICLSCDSRTRVSELVAKAVAAGGTTYAEPKDHGFMFQHGFRDPDGHIWELFYMDPDYVKKG